MSFDAVAAFEHIIDTFFGVDSPVQLLCREYGVNEHRKLRARLKNIRDLEYTDPITGTKVKLSDDELYEISALQSFLNTIQNETGPIDSRPIDITQLSRDDFLNYLAWEYDPDNPTKYDYALAKKAAEELDAKHKEEMRRLRMERRKEMRRLETELMRLHQQLESPYEPVYNLSSLTAVSSSPTTDSTYPNSKG